jgi:hypothetical protein
VSFLDRVPLVIAPVHTAGAYVPAPGEAAEFVLQAGGLVSSRTRTVAGRTFVIGESRSIWCTFRNDSPRFWRAATPETSCGCQGDRYACARCAATAHARVQDYGRCVNVNAFAQGGIPIVCAERPFRVSGCGWRWMGSRRARGALRGS